MRLPVLAVVLALSGGCGWAGNDDEEDKRTPGEEDANPVGVQPGGQPGANGADGANGTNGANGNDGANGTNGANGNDGATGPMGPQGKPGGVVLYDADDRAIGPGFMEPGVNAAHVVLADGKELLLDRQTGALKAPAFDFFCMYESANCSGACLLYDARWLNVVVLDATGQTWVAGRKAANLGPKTMNSYVTEAGVCEVATIGTGASFAAMAYTAVGLTFPLPAPLNWGLAN